MPGEHVLRRDLADGAVHAEVVVMVYGRILYVRTSILNAKSRQPKNKSSSRRPNGGSKLACILVL